MSKQDSAFPQVQSSNGFTSDGSVDSVWSEGGLTKRELLAAMAMQGLCGSFSTKYKEIPELATQIADALLAELAKDSK